MGERFSKWHGLGNDFVIIDRRAGGAPPDPAWAARVCDRHLGVGADGVLTMLPSARADARMHVTNPDGSVAETCGNGLRCVARHLFGRGAASPLRIEDGGGVRVCEDAGAGEVRVDMGEGRLVGDGPGGAVRVSFGNPHLVFFGGGEREARERGPLFPDANVEFVEKRGEGLEVWVWERGAGLTLACGSGACASALAAAARGWIPLGGEVPVQLPGGALYVTVHETFPGRVTMRGPAVHVFDGELPADL